jgi:hypothetical protein
MSISRRRLIAEHLYQKTEKHAAKFTKKFAVLLVALAISLVMQALGDSSLYLILDNLVRDEISDTKFLVFFTTICLSHVMLHKYLMAHQRQQ